MQAVLIDEIRPMASIDNSEATGHFNAAVAQDNRAFRACPSNPELLQYVFVEASLTGGEFAFTRAQHPQWYDHLLLCHRARMAHDTAIRGAFAVVGGNDYREVTRIDAGFKRLKEPRKFRIHVGYRIPVALQSATNNANQRKLIAIREMGAVIVSQMKAWLFAVFSKDISAYIGNETISFAQGTAICDVTIRTREQQLCNVIPVKL